MIAELREEYSEYVQDDDISLPSVLAKINVMTKEQFIIIIDEWDCLFREDKNNENLQKEYINFLKGLFKGTPSGAFLKLAYITGILPIKKYGTQSALNNFREHTMVSPRQMAEYVGFTEIEVRSICKEHDMPFKEMQRWYDGYYFEKIGHIYSPNSVIEAVDSGEFGNYWSGTETYESLMTYIAMDFDGLKQLIVDVLGDQGCSIDVESFQNDITSFKSADDVITLLIHMGYLAYDSKTKKVFIPNDEVRSVFLRAIRNDGWEEVIKAVDASEALLKPTLEMNEKAVAQMIQEVHMQSSSSLIYNNEISLSSVIALAYYSACRDYTLVRELPTGNGFADMVFLPKRTSLNPALVVELKWDKTAEGAGAAYLEQIKKSGELADDELSNVAGGGMICQKGAFLCAQETVNLSVAFTKKLSAGLFGGEGFILQDISGTGMVFLEVDGDKVEKQLAPGEVIKVDTGNVVAFEKTVQYEIETVKGLKNIFLGGEGLFLTKLTGPGKVILQTQNFNEFAGRIIKMVPSK